MSDNIAAPTVKTKTKLKEPSLYKVVFHNDDYTPMEFVSAALIQIYDKSIQEAEEIMIHVHKNGRGVAGTFTKEIAVQKKSETDYFSEMHQHPLKVTVEEAG